MSDGLTKKKMDSGVCLVLLFVTYECRAIVDMSTSSCLCVCVCVVMDHSDSQWFGRCTMLIV